MESEKKSFLQRNKWYILLVAGLFIYVNFFNKEETPQEEVIVEEKVEPTSGVVTTVKEIKTDNYKIVDEQVVPTKADSRIIAQHIDGQIDTFTMDQVMLVESSDTTKTHRRRHGSFFRGLVYGGMMGYVFGGRSWGTPLRRGSYANDRAYQQSNTAGRQRMRSTANVKTSRRSTSSRRTGYGSGRSTRSYGG